ncbi:IQ-DOMAIN 14, partial [Olea europaea subsp. europaea]
MKVIFVPLSMRKNGDKELGSIAVTDDVEEDLKLTIKDHKARFLLLFCLCLCGYHVENTKTVFSSSELTNHTGIQLTSVASARASAVEEAAAIKVQSVFRGYLGENLVTAVLTGPGIVFIQSMPFHRLPQGIAAINIYYYEPLTAPLDLTKVYNNIEWNSTKAQHFDAIIHIRCDQ